MWLRLVTMTILLAFASRTCGRPSDPDLSGDIVAGTTVPTLSDEGKDSFNSSQSSRNRVLKDLQYIDQSLRTVAKQLLNSTSKREELRMSDEKPASMEIPMQIVQISTNPKFDDEEDEEVERTTLEASKMKFGIPINSKFGHFELSNPGQAMAMTEEELEKEMATATTATEKTTTTSMLSTWIQLYPPSATEGNKNLPEETVKDKVGDYELNAKQSTSTTKHFTSTHKPVKKGETKQSSTMEKIKYSTTPAIQESSVNLYDVKVQTPPPSSIVENQLNVVADSSEKKEAADQTSFAPTTMKIISQFKKPNGTILNSKPKTTSPKTPAHKPSKNSLTNRSKLSTKRPSSKNETFAHTSKIEKVTLRPSSFYSAETTDRPTFITKIKASIIADAQKSATTTPPSSASSMRPVSAIISKANFSGAESSGSKISYPSKLSSLVKISHKRPIDDGKIEIQPIRVSPPVLTIEKLSYDPKEDLEEVKTHAHAQSNTEVVHLSVSPLIESPSTTAQPVVTTTTKRPRTTKKKNKKRRRKPSSSTAKTTVGVIGNSANIGENKSSSLSLVDSTTSQYSNDIKESKIEPELKNSSKKKKKKQASAVGQTAVQKPIGTQIYNFLSREVMPSVGVMSLVGLGLGLASYFLYPFGGVITRRNYDVEPNNKYKYSTERNGVTEEDYYTKVYKTISSTPPSQYQLNKKQDNFDKSDSFYRYTASDLSRYPPAPTPPKYQNNRVMYRPVGESVASPYDLNYRNSEYNKYGEVSSPNYFNPDASDSSSTPNYYQPQKDISTTDSYFHPITEISSTPPSYYDHREPEISSTPNYYQHREVETSTESNYYYNKDPEVSSTPNYYVPNSESSTPQSFFPRDPDDSSFINFYRRQPEVPIVGNSATVNQEFVVGSVPKDYSLQIDGVGKSKSDFFSLPDTYEQEEAQKESKQTGTAVISSVSIDRVPIAVNPLAKSAELDNQPLYEDIEVTPAPLLVEHGPRLFGARTVRVQGASERVKRETASTVIQSLAPSSKTAKSMANDVAFDNIDNEIGSFEDAAFANKNPTKAGESADEFATKKPSVPTQLTNGSNSANPSTSTSATSTTESKRPEPPLEDLSDLGFDDDDLHHGGGSGFIPHKPAQSGSNFNLFGFAKRLAEMKIRFGLTFLKKASENFARYIGRVQEKFNLEH